MAVVMKWEAAYFFDGFLFFYFLLEICEYMCVYFTHTHTHVCVCVCVYTYIHTHIIIHKG